MSYYEKLKTSKNPNNILILKTLEESLLDIDRELKEELMESLSKNFLKISKQVKLKEDFSEKKIKGYEGPFINQYLKGMCPTSGENKFKSIDEATKAANKSIYCSGITLTRQGYFTLRFGKELKDSDVNKRFKNKEITWVKNENQKIEFEEKKSSNPDEVFEIIKIKGQDYYYNIKNRICINVMTKERFILTQGNLISDL